MKVCFLFMFTSVHDRLSICLSLSLSLAFFFLCLCVLALLVAPLRVVCVFADHVLSQYRNASMVLLAAATAAAVLLLRYFCLPAAAFCVCCCCWRIHYRDTMMRSMKLLPTIAHRGTHVCKNTLPAKSHTKEHSTGEGRGRAGGWWGGGRSINFHTQSVL